MGTTDSWSIVSSNTRMSCSVPIWNSNVVRVGGLPSPMKSIAFLASSKDNARIEFSLKSIIAPVVKLRYVESVDTASWDLALMLFKSVTEIVIV